MTTDNITIRAALEKTVKALEDYMRSVETMNSAMKDGLNVHGAISGLIGATDNAEDALTEARAAMDAQGEDSYWSEVIGMFVERLNHGPQTTAVTDVLALLSDCQYLASLSHPQATEPAQSSNPSGEHSEPSLLGSEPAPEDLARAFEQGIGTNNGDVGSVGAWAAYLENQPAPNPWKDAVLDQLAAHCMDAPKDATPADILKRVICMAVTMATDPAISEPAPSTAGKAFTEWWGTQLDDSPTYQATFAAGYNAALLSFPALPVGELTDEQIDALQKKHLVLGINFDTRMAGVGGVHEFARAILAAARSQPVRGLLTPEELDLCRQWFNSVQDTNDGYLEPADYVLAEKLYGILKLRCPSSITSVTCGITKKGGE